VNNLVIIPARGGPKGIPKKNIRLLQGKRLLTNSIEQAWATPSVHRVIISTDGSEIATIAEQ
jgi:CMP-N-acetylneuraminic acid synthetase